MKSAAVLFLFVLLPLGSASPVVMPPVIGHFEFDQTAGRPGDVLEGVFVIQATQDTHVRGAVVLDDAGAIRMHQEEVRSEKPQKRQALVEVDEDMQAHSTVRIPFSIPIEGIGAARVFFDGGHDIAVDMEQVVGLAPVDVEGAATSLVSVPGRPAELELTITALPGSALTGLRLTAIQAEDVEVGDLPPGESFTATLTVPADGQEHGRFSGMGRFAFVPNLSGAEAGQNFTHPLYTTDGDRFEPIRPMLYVASMSTAFILPPDDASLKEPSAVDVVVLNAGTSAFTVDGRLDLRLDGMPHLGMSFDLRESVAPGEVETISVDWTPPAAGEWSAEVRHDIHAHGADHSFVTVAGPISKADLLLSPMERGERTTLDVVLTASEDTEISGVLLTSSRTPLRGAISIADLFRVTPVSATSLEEGVPATLEMDVFARATGSHEMFLVVETPDGPSLHRAGSLTVQGTTLDWPAAWAPTLGLFLLLGVHIVWRRRVP